MLVCDPWDDLAWVLGVDLYVMEGGIVFPRMLWDSDMDLGYVDVGVILLDPDSGVLIWIKLFRRDRDGAVINGR